MTLDIYQVDAFTDTLFSGNPAAICPLEDWIPDEKMQQIAMENNLSETAFFVKDKSGYRLRWFTPTDEVDLCGHATLASAHVLFEHLGYTGEKITFQTNSGDLHVHQKDGQLVMDFPATKRKKVIAPANLLKALNVSPLEVFKADDYMVVVEKQQQVENLDPNIPLLGTLKTRGVIVTARGEEIDFVSRFFAPSVGVDEDPVTGSAHTMLAPFWAKKLGKKVLRAQQISRRGGVVGCEVVGDRVKLKGNAITFLQGTISL